MSISQDYKTTEIGEIPEDWEVVGLKEIATRFISGGTPSTSNPEYWDGNIPWMRGAWIERKIVDSGERHITKGGLSNSATNIVPRENLVIATRVCIGNIAINKIDIAISQDLTGVVIEKSKALPEYVYWAFRNSENKVKQLVQGSTIKGVLRKDLEKIKIPRPPLPEQRKIATILSTVDEAIQKTDKVIKKAEMLKQGLIEKLLTRGIGHSQFKKTEVGEIPKKWDVVEIGDLVVDHNAGIYKKREYYGGGHNIVGVADLYYHDSINGQTFRLVELTQEEYEEYSLEEGDLIYGESSLVYEGIGKALVVTSRGEGTAFAWHTRRLKVDKARVNPYFLHHALNANYVRKSIMRRATRTAITGITVDEFFKTKVPLPNKTEQREIAERISSVDRKLLIEKDCRTKLEGFKKGLMQNLLSGKVRVKVD